MRCRPSRSAILMLLSFASVNIPEFGLALCLTRESTGYEYRIPDGPRFTEIETMIDGQALHVVLLHHSSRYLTDNWSWFNIAEEVVPQSSPRAIKTKVTGYDDRVELPFISHIEQEMHAGDEPNWIYVKDHAVEIVRKGNSWKFGRIIAGPSLFSPYCNDLSGCIAVEGRYSTVLKRMYFSGEEVWGIFFRVSRSYELSARGLNAVQSDDGKQLFFAGDAPSLDKAFFRDTDWHPYIYDAGHFQPLSVPNGFLSEHPFWRVVDKPALGRTELQTRAGWWALQGTELRPLNVPLELVKNTRLQIGLNGEPGVLVLAPRGIYLQNEDEISRVASVAPDRVLDGLPNIEVIDDEKVRFSTVDLPKSKRPKYYSISITAPTGGECLEMSSDLTIE